MLTDSDDQVLCAFCHEPLRAHARFCGKCGHALGDDPEETPGGLPEHQSTGEDVWPLVKPVLVFWVLLLALSGLIGLLGHVTDIGSPIYDLIFQLISTGIILVYVCKDRENLFPLLGNFGPSPKRSFILTGACLVILYVAMGLYFKLLELLGVEFVQYLTDYRSHHWPFWSAVLLIAVLPGVFEELAFRGVIMSRLQRIGSPAEAILLQAILFSVLHMLPAIFISHFFFGLCLGVLRRKTGSLYPAMTVHILWNFYVLLNEMLVQTP